MEASLQKQRESVMKQVKGAQAAPSGDFFTVPFPALPEPPIDSPECDPLPPQVLTDLISGAATAHSLQPSLLREVIKRESAGRPCVISSKGAQGLMQIMPATAEDFGLADPFDAKQNVETGAKFLKQLITKYAGNLEMALGAYNAGPARIDQLRAVPKTGEIRDYVRAILSAISTARSE